MPKVVVVRGYVVSVFTEDHGFPHVHVYKDGILLKIRLNPVSYVSAKYGRPTERMKREGLEIVEEHREACLIVWRKIYGEGPYR